MRRITSINNAIKYFKEGTKIEMRTTQSGTEYTVFIPPKSFRRMNVSYPVSHVGVITTNYRSWQWKDYATILERDKAKICKLTLYYED